MKKCSRCKLEKDFSCFNKMKSGKDGHQYKCKNCEKEYADKNKEARKISGEEYRKNNKDKIKETNRLYNINNNEKLKKKKKEYYQEHKEEHYLYNKEYRNNNKEKTAEYHKQYQEDNKEELLEYGKAYREENKERLRKRELDLKNAGVCVAHPLKQAVVRGYCEECKIKYNLRSRIRMAFKAQGWKKDSKTQELLGADFETVKAHIESQFLPGMSWENHGIETWHIDHNIPLVAADTKEELEKLFHYTNLQPLWAKDNLKKNGKY